MADTKISALPSSTTPLSGTEVLPIVQSSTTKKVAVSDLTSGRDVTVQGLTTTNNICLGITPSVFTGFKGVEMGTVGNAVLGLVNGAQTIVTKNGYLDNGVWKYANSGATASIYEQGSGGHLWFISTSGTAGNAISFTQAMTLDASSNLTLNAGNVVIGASGKGLDFAGNGNVLWRCGSGTPEGSVTAPIGSLYTRTDGGANTTLYVKESGSGNTGWVAK